MSQFKENILIEDILKKLPENIANKFDNPLLKDSKWSEEWERSAKDICLDLNYEKDKGTISLSEFNYLHTMVFHSFGKIGGNSSDFFRFYTGL